MNLTKQDLLAIENLLDKKLETKLDEQFIVFETELDKKLNARFIIFENRLDEKLDKRFKSSEHKMNKKLDTRLDSFEKKFNQALYDMGLRIDGKILRYTEQINKRIDDFENYMISQFQDLTQYMEDTFVRKGETLRVKENKAIEQYNAKRRS